MIPVYEINIYVGNHVSDWGIQEHIHSLQKLFEKDFHVSTSLSIREGVINVILDEFSDKKKTRNLIKVIKNFQNKNYSLERDILIKVIELKKLIAYKTDRQYFSITNLKMLKKFKIICKQKNLNYVK